MISCLMVTLASADRLEHIRRSVNSYLRQTWADRELVIVTDQTSVADFSMLADYLSTLQRPDIRLHTHPTATLGALRNASLSLARGDVVCQWDDDDMHHPQRLAIQREVLEADGYDAVYCSDVLQYFPLTGALHWTNWRGTEIGGHPGSLMARNSTSLRYPEHGEQARLGEDLELARWLKAHRRIGYLTDKPHLFVYVSHGRNSWHNHHHEMLARSLSLSAGLTRRRWSVISAEFTALDLPGVADQFGREFGLDAND